MSRGSPPLAWKWPLPKRPDIGNSSGLCAKFAQVFAVIKDPHFRGCYYQMALLVSFHLYICASQIDICADEQIWPEFYLTVTGLVLPTNFGYSCILLVLNRLILAAVLLTPETSAIKFSWSILVKLVLQLKCLLVQTHNSKCDISTDNTAILYIVYSSTLSLSLSVVASLQIWTTVEYKSASIQPKLPKLFQD